MLSAERPIDEQDRLGLEYIGRELATNETRIYDHVTTTFRWLMATLFAANGGAIVALCNAPPPLSGHLEAMGWFAAGTILSLAMGALSALMGHRVIRPLTNARAKLHQGLITGDAADAEQALLELVEKQKMNWKMWSPTYAGLGSLACFIIGIGTMACSMI